MVDIQVSNKKILRRIEHTWNKLVKLENFLISETIEEWKDFGFLKTPSITIKKFECFFKAEFIPILNALVQDIYSIDIIKKHFTYNTIYHKVLDQIEQVLLLKVEGVSRKFQEAFQDLLAQIVDKCKNYEFTFQVKGISISDRQSIVFGDSLLFMFDEKDQEYIESYVSKEDVSFQERVNLIIRTNLFEKTCIRCNSYGDLDFAENNALSKAKTIIDVLRYMFCYLYPEYIYQNVVKINLVSDMMVEKDNYLSINLDDRSVTLHWDSRKSTHQDYIIDQEVINGFKKNCFWDDLVSILIKKQKTELEESISNAIYWVGEAQNEWIPQIAYIKFWTAIEALTYNPLNNEKVTETIVKGVSTLLIYGGYHYYPVEEYWNLRKRLRKLYDKRSKIIHRGVLENIPYDDLRDICKYSTQMVSEVLGLCSLGYTHFDQVRKEAERLHKNQLRNMKL